MADIPPSSLTATIARYSSSKAYAFVLRILTGFMRPFLLAPELFGIWNLFAIILQYAEYYLHLGCVGAMRFRLPQLWEQKADDDAKRVTGAAFKGSLASHAVASIAVTILALAGNWEGHVRDGLFTVAVIILTLWYQRFLIQFLQARQNFTPIARANYIRATNALVVGAPLIYFFSIHGIYWTALIGEAILILYLRRHCRERIAYPFEWPVYRSLTVQGFPIMVFDIASNLARTADRFLIAAMLGTEQLGFYALAAFVFTALLEVPGAAREVLEPRMMQESVTLSPDDLLEAYFFRPLLNTAFYIPLLIGPVVFAAPFIELVLPRYAAGILPAQILAIGGYFLAISFVARGVIVANGWQVKALIPVFAATAVNAVLAVLAMQMDFGIAGVAVASSVSYALLLGLLIGFIKKRHSGEKAPWARYSVATILPFILLVGTVVGFFALAELLAVNQWLAAILQIICFSALMFGFLHLAHRLYPLVARPNLAPVFALIRKKQ
jgi:O-antigen/teichoic acid export membrane protein